ncbi:MAG: DUF6702 family protein [Bacteroidales bacterium]
MSFILSLLIAGMSAMHPLHITYTSIEIDRENDSISLSHKFFTDDFTLLFHHLFEKKVEPKMNQEFSTPELDLIKTYLSYRFILTSGTDTIPLHFQHKDQDDESLWLYFKGRLPDNGLKSLSVQNQLLLDLYEDQTNLVIIICGKEEKGFKFNSTDQRAVYEIGKL